MNDIDRLNNYLKEHILPIFNYTILLTNKYNYVVRVITVEDDIKRGFNFYPEYSFTEDNFKQLTDRINNRQSIN